MYRKKDLQYLQDIFDRSSNDIAVLYGKRSSGLNSIISDLIRDKQSLYYKASAVNDALQRRLFAGELMEQTRSPIFPNDDYDKLISSYISENTDRKKLIVFDDFIYLIRENPTFINFLANLLFKQSDPGLVMVLLVCDDINWIENDMVRTIGRKSSEISGIVKLNEYSATEFRECFPQMPLSEAMGIYAFLGGRSEMYDELSDGSKMRDVIIRELERWSESIFDPNAYLPKSLREPVLYNTILANIATGNGKLNDLHKATGIERAKLSVYLKALIREGIVEKVVSSDVGTGTDTVKGLYRICERMIGFYYRFVFCHLSSLHVMGPERFYRKYIEHEIMDYMEEYYPVFAMEQVKWLRDHNLLNFRVAAIEEYHDRNRSIDFVIIAAGGSVIACSCRYGPPHMSYRAYEEVKAAVRKNKIPCDNIWLFSASGFDQKLSMFGSVTPGVKLIDGQDQRLR